MGAGVGGRTTNQGYGQLDGNRKKWAQLERDDETGLDYAQARYYSPTMGRFTSPDEFSGGPDELYFFADDAAANPTFYANLSNPQSLNKYQYAYNNPLRYVDPDGHDPDPDPPCCQDTADHTVSNGLVAAGATLSVISLTSAGATVLVVDAPVTVPVATVSGIGAGVAFAGALVARIIEDVTARPRSTAGDSSPPAQPQVGTPPLQQSQTGTTPPITMGKGSTRDVRKINPGREASAKKAVADARAEVARIKSIPNKTANDQADKKTAERALNRALDQLKKSETDARRGRTNRR